MKNDTDTVPHGGKYMREIERVVCAIGSSIDSAYPLMISPKTRPAK